MNLQARGCWVEVVPCTGIYRGSYKGIYKGSMRFRL